MTHLREALTILEGQHRRRTFELVRGLRIQHEGLLRVLNPISVAVAAAWQARWLVFYPRETVRQGAGYVFVSDLRGNVQNVAQHRFSEDLQDALQKLQKLVVASQHDELKFRLLDASEEQRRLDANSRVAFQALVELTPIEEYARIHILVFALEFSECSVPATTDEYRAFEGILLLAGDGPPTQENVCRAVESVSQCYKDVERTIERFAGVPQLPNTDVAITRSIGGGDMKHARPESSGGLGVLAPDDARPWRCPLLRYWARSRQNAVAGQLQNTSVLLIQHLLGDFRDFVRAFGMLGFRTDQLTVVGIPYSTKDYVVDEVRQSGATVYAPTEYPIQKTVEEAIASVWKRGGRFVIVEDGGYAVPLLHGNLSAYAANCVGAVEQTANGIWRSEEALKAKGSASFPVIDVARSKSKGEVEGRLVADAIVTNVRAILLRIGKGLRGKKVLVVGHGTVGKQIALALRHIGARGPAVYDDDPMQKANAHSAGFDVTDSLVEACRDADVVIGCTGKVALRRPELLALKSGAVLVNASSKRLEFDYEELEALCGHGEHIEGLGTVWDFAPSERKITILADGYPVKFFDAESIPDEEIQFVPTLMLEGVVQLLATALPPKIVPYNELRFTNRSGALVEAEKEILDLYRVLGT